MTSTTIKRAQAHKDWWFTVENCNTKVAIGPNTGLSMRMHYSQFESGRLVFSVDCRDAIAIRDAINELYPVDNLNAVEQNQYIVLHLYANKRPLVIKKDSIISFYSCETNRGCVLELSNGESGVMVYEEFDAIALKLGVTISNNEVT